MTVKSLYPFVNPSSLLESPQSNLNSNSQLLHRYGVYMAYALAYHAATRYERVSVKAACRRSTAIRPFTGVYLACQHALLFGFLTYGLLFWAQPPIKPAAASYGKNLLKPWIVG